MADEETKKPIIADPLAGTSETDTGSLSAISDTQTRKTVKLKPIAKPDEHERKTVILKNIAGEIEKANVVDTPESKETIVLPAPEVKASEVSDDETVKISRPVIAKKTVKLETKTVLPPGVPQESKSTIKLTPPPAPEVKPEEKKPEAEDTETVKLARPAVKISKPAEEPKKEEVAAAPDLSKIDFNVAEDRGTENSVALTVMVALSAILLCGAAVWAAIQYFE